MNDSKIVTVNQRVEIHAYDRDTIEYLRALGVGEPLLDRVRRLAEEVAQKTGALAGVDPE